MFKVKTLITNEKGFTVHIFKSEHESMQIAIMLMMFELGQHIHMRK